jgi:DNA-binding NtrC family response regulator
MQKKDNVRHQGSHARGTVLVLGEHEHVRRSLREHLVRLGYRPAEFLSTPELLEGLSRQPGPVAILLDCSPESVCDTVASLSPCVEPVPLVVVSADSDPERVVKAVRLGAAGYLNFPLDEQSMRKALDPEAQSLRRNDVAVGRALPPNPPLGFVCVSPKMRQIMETVRRVADSDITVLIRGESGVGKEVIARYVHTCSSRASGPFVKVNCAALPEELLESELFGYQRGAFTGAATDKPGKFETANEGTIFLDEITETSGRLQAKLLHVLQDKKVVRVGGNREIDLDVRILAATNAELEQQVAEGRFREDLYFRLKVIDVYVPPLRERREEIPVLLDHFLRHFSQQYRKPIPELSEPLLNLLTNHRWSGNVRELENLTKRLVILGDERPVVQELLSKIQFSTPAAGALRVPVAPSYDSPPVESPLSLKKVAERAALAAEKNAILSTLEKTRWNRMKASRILGVSYKTLLTKMKKCGLTEA